jgi:hypothetical protein
MRRHWASDNFFGSSVKTWISATPAVGRNFRKWNAQISNLFTVSALSSVQMRTSQIGNRSVQRGNVFNPPCGGDADFARFIATSGIGKTLA